MTVFSIVLLFLMIRLLSVTSASQDYPMYIASHDNTVFISYFSSNRVSVLNLKDMTQRVFIPLPYLSHCRDDISRLSVDCDDIRPIDGPAGLVVYDNDSVLFVASFGSDLVYKVSVSTGRRLGYLGNSDILDCPNGLALETSNDLSRSSRLFVSNYLSNSIVEFDVSTHKVMRVIHSVIPRPEHLLFDSVRSCLVVSSYSNNSVAIISSRSSTQPEYVSTSPSPSSSISFNSVVKVFRGISDGDRIPVSPQDETWPQVLLGPLGLALTPNADAYLVACYKVFLEISLKSIVVLRNTYIVKHNFGDRSYKSAS